MPRIIRDYKMRNKRVIMLSIGEALLAAQGKLTAIVRRMKPQPMWVSSNGTPHTSGDANKDKIIKPPFLPGSIVPAKETWMKAPHLSGMQYMHKADNYDSHGKMVGFRTWRSPILMPLASSPALVPSGERQGDAGEGLGNIFRIIRSIK